MLARRVASLEEGSRTWKAASVDEIEVREESVARLPELGSISIAFQVTRVLAVQLQDHGLHGIRLAEQTLDSAYVKDYDAIPGEGPSHWAERFDVSNWGMFGAWSSGRRIGAAVIAWSTPGFPLLENRPDIAVIWDLRVEPSHRGRGVAGQLFSTAAAWAGARGCTLLKVETQTTNVPACRFYIRMGCRLGGVNLYAYPDLPHEAQLLWYRSLRHERR